MKDFVIGHFPAGYEDMVFVEAFAGGASVSLNKRPSRLDVINDIDRRMINLFRTLRDEPDRFIGHVAKLAYAESVFEEAILRISDGGASPFEEACDEYVARRMSRGGMRKAFAWSERLRGGKPGDLNAWETMLSLLPRISDRLQGVLLHNQDFSSILDLYDDRNVLIYLDPPYLPETRKSTRVYAHEMDLALHDKMLATCSRSRSKIIISGYASELYEDRLTGWNRFSIDVANHSSQSESKQRRTEILWTNYDPAA